MMQSDYRGREGLLLWRMEPELVDFVNFTIKARVKIGGLVAGEPVKLELERQFFSDSPVPVQPENDWMGKEQQRAYERAKAWIDALLEQYRAGTLPVNTTSEAFNTWIAEHPQEKRLAQDLLYL